MKRRRQSILIDIVLNRLLTVYRDEIADCDLRANVMTANRHKSLLMVHEPETLAIDHSIGGYSEWERELTFGPGEGTAGMALREGEIVVYDSRTKRYPEQNMTVEQLVATEYVTSVISVPIYSSSGKWGKPIGILNLDSTEHVGDTKFNTESARMVSVKHARAIGDVLE